MIWFKIPVFDHQAHGWKWSDFLEKKCQFSVAQKQLETSAAHLKKQLVTPMKRLEIS